MGKGQETSTKKDREKKRRQKKEEKAKKMEMRKANNNKGKSLDEMIAYTDEYGNITAEKPDLTQVKPVRVEDMIINTPKLGDKNHADTERKGIVTYFNSEKGYGFIKDTETRNSIFVHTSGTKETLVENDRVLFKLEKGPRGLNAVSVKKA
ncbi:MAG: cold-shock protein [Chitinophagales bacterium]